MLLSVLQRVRRIARRRESLHQTECDPRVVGVLLRQSLPPAHRAHEAAGFLGTRGQRLQRLGVARGQPPPLRVQPALELIGAPDMKAIQQRAAVETHGLLQLAAVEGLLECRRVTLQRALGYADLFAGTDDDLLAQVLPEELERFAKRAPAVLVIELGPEQSQ